MYVARRGRGFGQAGTAIDPGCVAQTDSSGNIIENCVVSSPGMPCGGVSTFPFFGIADADGFCTPLSSTGVMIAGAALIGGLALLVMKK